MQLIKLALSSAIVCAACALAACQASAQRMGASAVAASATFTLRDADLPEPLVLVAYGDMRFTNPSETVATLPAVRRALIAKVATEHPAALFLTGDIPWHGKAADYAAFRDETAPWRDASLRVYPALGNHEFSQCAVDECLGLWWDAFPQLRGRRWYSVAMGSKLLALALDSDAPLTPGSEQRVWLESQLGALDTRVRFVLVVLHHPPVADIQSSALADHNPRINEQELAQYLGGLSSSLHAGILVIAGHVHNYEHIERGGVTYLVSGGGGARPYEVDRDPDDHYATTDFPNFHYVRLQLSGNRLKGEMIRLGDPNDAEPNHWEVRDRFEISPRP